MLQGFYWDSYSETNWAKLTSQADELAKYFNLIWVPNSGMTSTYYWDKSEGHANSNTMGYDPCFWLNHNSCWGTENQLRTMINTFKEKGTGIIEDVVINHKNGLSGWTGFPDEDVTGTVTGKDYKITWHPLQDICRNDEANYSDNSDAKGQITGANDTGDNFDGFRDLDHTNTEVQQNVETYLDYLKNELGYVGFRYDMVKGYAPQYTKIYNESAKPEFSVGEYWDGDYNNVYTNWACKTGDTYRSAAFDFPLKFAVINNAFGGSKFNKEAFSNKGLAGDGANGANRYSVTFVDNHDTYRDANKLGNNVLAANAFILALPGTPCIFWPHWTAYKAELEKMIEARKAAGITNQSSIIEEGQDTDGDGYYMVVQGTKGKVLYIAGNMADDHTQGYTNVSSGTPENPNYAYFVKFDSSTPEPDDPSDQPTATDGTINIYVQSASTPKLYAYNDAENDINGKWPGTDMAKVTINGKEYYHYATTKSPLNIILNYTGDTDKTGDIMDITSDKYYYFTAKNATEITGRNYDPVTTLTTNDSVYCIAPTSGGQVYAYAWNGGSNNSWPGVAATKSGVSGSNTIWSWSANGLTFTPVNIIFDYGNNKNQTANLTYTAGNTYIWDGGSKTNATSVSITPLPVYGSSDIAAGRTFSNGVTSTFALPFNLTADEVAKLGGKVYKMSNYDNNGILHFEEAKTVEAYHPYLFIGDSDVQPFISYANKIWQQGSAIDEESNGFHFVGNFGAKKNIVSNSQTNYYTYLVTDGKGIFTRAGNTQGMYILGYRCYFYQDASSSAAKPSGIAFDGGTTTSINKVNNNIKKDDAWYNLQGQRISKPSHGVYIHAGKKIVIK